MRGILTKRDDKWVVIYNEADYSGEIVGKSLLVHPDDCWINDCDGNEGTEYEFEIDREIKLDDYNYRYTEITAKLLYKVNSEDEINLWIDIYHQVKRTGKETIYDVFVWLKEHYEPPKLRKNED